MIYAIRTIGKKEDLVAEMIKNRAIENSLQIYSVFRIEELKNYVFIEGEEEDILIALQGIPFIRRIVKQPMKVEEFEKYFAPKKEEIEIEIGDLVEVIGGPFKGQKGKVTKYDKIKGEITIELLEAAIPLPVTLNVSMVKIVEKKK